MASVGEDVGERYFKLSVQIYKGYWNVFFLSLHMNYVYLADAKDRKKTQVLKPFSVSIFPPLRKFDCLTQEVISNFPDESCLF